MTTYLAYKYVQVIHKILKTTFGDSVFKQHIVLGGSPNRFASTQCAISLYAAGTSYDLQKTHFSSLDGGRAMGAMLSGPTLHTKEKTWRPSWGFFFSQNLIFLQKIFFKALRAKTNITQCGAHEK